MKKQYTTLFLALLGMQLHAQESKTVNQGDLSVMPGTQVSTYFDFENKSSGNVFNDGEMHFFGDYDNEGLFSYSTNQTTGYVVFEGLHGNMQSISGNAPSFFYDALYRNASGFSMSNSTTYGGTVNLYDGVVVMDKAAGGSFIFLKGATHTNTSDRSHVEGEVTKEGNESFTYPIGDQGYYRMAGISAPISATDSYTGEYVLSNTNGQYPHSSKTGVIDRINDQEHWLIEKTSSSEDNVLVTLSWDERTTPNYLLDDNRDRLHVVRWDKAQQLWVDEGGVVDVGSKTVTTLTKVEDFGVYTLATIKPQIINPGDVVIYNGVTPDGDGMNDYFIIDNIWLYPQNTVRIYNRWGKEVYHTESYNSTGNVFTGIAQGKGIVSQGEPLPTGTYYYVVEYFYTRDGINQWVKKVGYLHLETE